MKISLIIPMYNESSIIDDAVSTFGNYMKEHFEDWELIFVDDGSADGCGATVAAAHEKDERIKLISYQPNRGKGYAVRQGMLAASGDISVFTDCDNAYGTDVIGKIYDMFCGNEDADIIVVNKPKGMVVHPAAGNYTGTLVNALLYHCGESLSGIGGVIRPGIVHRIDKDTGGLLVVAKNDEAHLFLSDEIKEHKVSRIYHAIAIGRVKENTTIDLPIGRHPTDRKKMAVTEKNSKSAVTHVEVLEGFDTATYVRCILETGRTHQIRVHLSHTGHPLVGDLVYGSPKYPQNQKYAALCQGQCLHAKELTLTHPRTKETMHFECALPAYFEELLTLLGKIYSAERNTI